MYFYIPTEGEGAVTRKWPGRPFKEVDGIRKINSVQTTSTQCKVFTRHHSCVCEECLSKNSGSCVNSAFVDGWREVEIDQDGQVAVTRQNQDAADTERVNGITDMVEVSHCSS